MVSRSAMAVRSDLFGELLEQIGVRPRVDLTSQQLAGGTDGDAGHLAAQALLRTRGVQIDLLLRSRHDARGLRARRALGLLDHLVGAVLRVVDDLVGALAGLANDRVRLAARLRQLALAFLGGREPLRDLALAFIHRLEDWRPDPLHRDEDERGEHDHLHDEREIDVHGAYLPSAKARSLALSAPPVPRRETDSRT